MKTGDTIHLADFGNRRYTLFDAAKSFFGLIKIGEDRTQHQQHPQVETF